MSKRIANDQMTREELDFGASDDENAALPQVQTASAEVMNRRKIAMPKRKMDFTTKTTNSIAESSFANAFSFAKKPVVTASDSTSDDKNAKLKALNLQFKEKITEFISRDSCADLTSVFSKYELYLKDICNKDTGKTNPSVSPVVNKPKPAMRPPSIGFQAATADADSESSSEDDDEEMEVKVQGPQFTIPTKPINSDSVFSFGKKKQAQPKDDSDSESDIEIKGPEFTFSGNVNSDVFKFNNKKETKDETKEETKPVFSFGAPSVVSSNDDQKKDPDTNKPALSFNFGTTPTAVSSVKKEEPEVKKPSFSFGGIAPAPTSIFGNNNISEKTTTPTETKAPSFSFGALPSSTEDKKESPKPSFSFGTGATTKVESKEKENKPSFSFVVAAPAATERESNDKPKFSFGVPATTDKKDTEDKPKYSFGVSSNAATTDNKAPSFSFLGQSSDTKKDVAEEKKDDLKPSFSFDSTSSATAAAPSFSFGKPAAANPFTASASTTTNDNSKPSGGFKFSLPFEQKATPEKIEEVTPAAASTVDAVSGTQKDITPAVEATPSEDKKESSTISLQNGEEDEDALFTQRAKLMIFNPETKAYDSRGVGEMKVLQRKDDKSKIRLLCRSDGMGNILLNTSVVKSFEYVALTAESDNLVKTHVVGSDGKLSTYIVKFKLKSDGRQFMKTIEDCKKDME